MDIREVMQEVVIYVEGLNRDLIRRGKAIDNLFNELEQLKKEIELRDRLIELVEADIIWQERQLGKMAGKQRERMAAIVDAYRQVKGGEYEYAGTAAN